MSQTKYYCFTLNNYENGESEEIAERLRSRCNYFIIGKEIGETGTPHLQGYCVFTSRCGFSTAKDRISARCHIEAARGTPDHNKTYCSKGGDFVEYGDLPAPSHHRRAGKSRDELGREFRAAIGGGRLGLARFAEDNPGTYMFSGHTLLRNSLALEPPRVRDAIQVQWIWGRPGIGKSRRAHGELPEAYIKDPRTKWWNGYLLEEEVIIDDFGPGGIDINHLLRWFDRYKCFVETKGGMMPLCMIKCIVTSNFHPRVVYTDNLGVCHPQIEALERRIVIEEIL